MFLRPGMILKGALFVFVTDLPARCSGAPMDGTVALAKNAARSRGELSSQLTLPNAATQSGDLVLGDRTAVGYFNDLYAGDLRKGDGNAHREMKILNTPVRIEHDNGFITEKSSMTTLGRHDSRRQTALGNGGSLSQKTSGSWARHSEVTVTTVRGFEDLPVADLFQRLIQPKGTTAAQLEHSGQYLPGLSPVSGAVHEQPHHTSFAPYTNPTGASQTNGPRKARLEEIYEDTPEIINPVKKTSVPVKKTSVVLEELPASPTHETPEATPGPTAENKGQPTPNVEAPNGGAEVPETTQGSVPTGPATHTPAENTAQPVHSSRSPGEHPEPQNGAPQVLQQTGPEQAMAAEGEHLEGQSPKEETGPPPAAPSYLMKNPEHQANIEFKKFRIIAEHRWGLDPKTLAKFRSAFHSEFESPRLEDDALLDQSSILFRYLKFLNDNRLTAKLPVKVAEGSKIRDVTNSFHATFDHMNMEETFAYHHPEVTPTQKKYFVKWLTAQAEAQGRNTADYKWNKASIDQHYQEWQNTRKDWKFKLLNFWDQAVGGIRNFMQTLRKTFGKAKSD
ncbi:hypothetical protein PtA15_16A190 [Puccinia triticina]|uniref:RxLR effector protein n=1 Tax=Puccinia triticina TaxID=208348 RepID=A0ABY7D3U7_9BASI|nr:uncharacterized protein PtA15_16A190 [Puccinia triticina]WAQ92284.1 hypothetical protein PtA15_16A190 [Puccinia triticina]